MDNVLGYLKSARMEHGLVINFGSPRFQIKKFALSPSEKSPNVSLFASLFASFAFFRG